jgi:hypothetical protein
MYDRLDDELLDHPKIFAAGKRLGADGPVIVTGFYALCLLWCNRHLTDGFLPLSTIESFRHAKNPVAVADALAHGGLFDKVAGGYSIHDFADYNPSAKVIKAKRKEDRNRKRAERAAKNGHA